MSKTMNLTVSRLAAVLVLVGLSACKCMESKACDASLSKADHAAISAGNAVWLKAVRAADWTALAATYSTEAMLMPPNQPAVSGREAIRKWFAAFPPITKFDLEEKEVDGCCNVAYVRGTYSFTIAPPGAGTFHETGKYLEIHRKQADGTWLMLRDMFSSDEPAPH